MSDQSVDILVIGNGVSAKALLWELELADTKAAILQVSSDKLFPRTSLSSTAIVAKHGMKKGVSPLGDLLVLGVEHFFKNVYSTGLMGIEKSFFTDLVTSDEVERMKSRYGVANQIDLGKQIYPPSREDLFAVNEECLFINPPVFLSSLDEQFNTPLKKKTLVSVKKKTALFNDKSQIHFKKLVLAHGAGLCLLEGLGFKNSKKISEVPGAYLKWDLNLEVPSFAYGLGGANLIYRKADQCLMLGGTTEKAQVFSPDLVALKNFYEKATSFGFSALPRFEEARIEIGTRVKGPKRLPLFEEVSEDVFILGAAYKNGWSQAFYGASELLKRLL